MTEQTPSANSFPAPPEQTGQDDYLVFLTNPDGTMPRKDTGRHGWKPCGSALFIPATAKHKYSYIRGSFTTTSAEGNECTYQFKARTIDWKTPPATPGKKRPAYDFWLLDEHGWVPTKPDPRENALPTDTVWVDPNMSMWLDKSKASSNLMLSGTLTLEGVKRKLFIAPNWSSSRGAAQASAGSAATR